MSKKKDAANFTYKSGKTEITGSSNDQNLMKLVKWDFALGWMYRLIGLILVYRFIVSPLLNRPMGQRIMELIKSLTLHLLK